MPMKNNVPRKKRVQISLDDEVLARLEKIAFDMGLSKSNAIAVLINREKEEKRRDK